MKLFAFMGLLSFPLLLSCQQSGGAASGGDSLQTQSTAQPSENLLSAGGGSSKRQAGDVLPDVVVVDAERLHPFQEGYAVVEKGNAQALIDRQGAFFIPYNQYLFGAMQGDYWEENGRYHHVESNGLGFHRGLCLVGIKSQDQYGSDRTLWGCINAKKELVIPATYYDFQRQTSDNLFLRSVEHGYTVCFNRKGQIVRYPDCWQNGQVVKPSLSVAGRYYRSPYLNGADSILIVQGYQGSRYKYGLADFAGKTILEPVYDQLEPFSEGLAAAMQYDAYGQPKWGFINAKGEAVITPQFSNQPRPFHCGRALVEPKDKTEFSYAYIDAKGETKIKLSPLNRLSGDVIDFRNGLVTSPNVYGLLDVNGREYNLGVIQGRFIDVETGQLLTNIHHSGLMNGYEIRDFRADQILLSHSAKKGLIDINGTLLLPPVFAELSLFDTVSGLAYARYEDRARGIQREGYINTKGVFVITRGQGGQW